MQYLLAGSRTSLTYLQDRRALASIDWPTVLDDLIDAVKWAVKAGYADEKRVAIYGTSYGGYAALVGATFTPEVFACAVDIVGPSNLVTLMRSMTWRYTSTSSRLSR